MPDDVKQLTKDALSREGVPSESAEIIADVILTAELRGVSSHGLKMLPVYLERVRRGGLDPQARAVTTKVGDGLFVVDGKGGFGQVAAQLATEIIIEVTGQNRVAVVAIKNTNHCGMLAYYTRQIARKFALGFMAANTNPNMPAFGGAEKVLGTNPFSIAVPDDKDCILVDMATTSIAKGKIYEYKSQNRAIPPGCALNTDGEETTIPEEALNGLLLPFGGHKGYAIALVIELLAGVTSGAGYSKHTHSLHDASDVQQNLGVFMQGIPLMPFMRSEEYERRIRDFSHMIKDGKLAKGSNAIYFPGEIEKEKENIALQNGIEISDALLRDIQ
jgi:L-2-hydroxycarboxylate dehydrogenase (NAD+)